MTSRFVLETRFRMNGTTSNIHQPAYPKPSHPSPQDSRPRPTIPRPLIIRRPGPTVQPTTRLTRPTRRHRLARRPIPRLVPQRTALALLPDIAPDCVVAAVRFGEGLRFVFGAAEAFVVAGFEESGNTLKSAWSGGLQQEDVGVYVCVGTHFPVSGFTSPPSETGISRLSPAPDAEEP